MPKVAVCRNFEQTSGNDYYHGQDEIAPRGHHHQKREFSFYVEVSSVGVRNKTCAGVFVDQFWILTAAECIRGHVGKKSLMNPKQKKTHK